MTQPNILYIHSHDTGRHIQPYGYPVPTPRLQRLAEEGVLFRNAFCANPTCSPSRAALLTGTYPHSPHNGMFGLAHLGWSLADPLKHIVHTLNAAGYRSALSGAQHITTEDNTPNIGYHEYLGAPAPDHIDAENLAADWLLNLEGDTPFFLDVGFHETHREFPPADPDFNPAHLRPPAPLPDTPETRADYAAYLTMARTLDRKIGVVLDALDASGRADNTLVICTTDHGIPFPLMKCRLTDHGTGVLLILRGPGGFRGGLATDALASHVDLFPTLCDLASIPRPSWLQGVSLLPLVQGAPSVRDEVFAEVNVHTTYEPMRSVRTARWKYILRLHPSSTPVLGNCDESPSKQLLLSHGWRDLTQPREELYDLLFDPTEARNLADDPAHAPILADLRARLHQHRRDTADPMLDGHFPIPPAARVVPLDSPTQRTQRIPLSDALHNAGIHPDPASS